MVLQLSEMLGITLGLDVLTQQFFPDRERFGASRHHPDRDKSYYSIFSVDLERRNIDFKMKLIPIDSTTHFSLHAKYKLGNNFYGYSVDNELARKRVKHLYEIIQRKYDSSTNYRTSLMAEFNGRTERIGGRDQIRIWNEFNPIILEQWIDRYIDKKEIEKTTGSDEQWFIKEYSQFWQARYVPTLFKMIKYLNEEDVTHKDFWDWYYTEYVKNNIYPILY